MHSYATPKYVKIWESSIKTLVFLLFGTILAVVAATQNVRMVVAAGGPLVVGVVGIAFNRYGEKLAAAVFGIFMVLTILFNRSFSHVAIPGPPFYVTELTMAGVTAMLWFRGKLRIPRTIRPLLLGVMAVMVTGIVVNGPRFGFLPVIRDSAELYYIWFVPLSYSVYRVVGPYITPKRTEWILFWALWIVPAVYLATASTQLPSMSESVSAMLILTIFVWNWHFVPETMIWPALVLNIVSLVHWGARGPWVGLGLALVVLLAMGQNISGGYGRRLRMRFLTAAALGLWLIGLIWLVDESLLTQILRDVLSLTTFHGSYNQVANNRWRLIVWEEAGRQFLSNPLALRVGQPWIPEKLVALGYGGWNAAPGFAQNTVALSDSYLQMMQWYGLWAIIPVGLVVYEGLKRLLGAKPWTWLQVLVASFLAVWAVVTGVEVVLEGPYMSAVVWSLIGLALYFPEYKTLINKRREEGCK